MKRSAFALISALLLAACNDPGMKEIDGAPSLPPAEASKYRGVYAGSYVCGLGENGLTVSIDSVVSLVGQEPGLAKVDGRLWFYDVNSNVGHPAGSYYISGTIDSEGTILVNPTDWISPEPQQWGAAGIDGMIIIGDAQTVMQGRPSGDGTQACQDFTLVRLEGLKG